MPIAASIAFVQAKSVGSFQPCETSHTGSSHRFRSAERWRQAGSDAQATLGLAPTSRLADEKGGRARRRGLRRSVPAAAAGEARPPAGRGFPQPTLTWPRISPAPLRAVCTLT
jgi:hypothetical protein